MISVVVKPPSECSAVEIDKFQENVLAQGKVVEEGLRDRIKRAVGLVFLYVENDMAGIAAMKHPYKSYKSDVFKKARVPKAENFTKELGWVYVPARHQGNRYSRMLVEAAMRLVEKDSVFATTSSNRMRSTLERFGFTLAGDQFASKEGDSLQLYIRRSR